MIEVAGKQVFTELSEIVDPVHTALLIVDMQRDFCSAGGGFDQLGVDLSMYPPVIERIGELIAAARQAGVLLVFIQMTVLPGQASDSPAQIRFNLRLHDGHHGEAEPLAYTLDGSDGQRFVPGLEPQDGELVVKKYRSSAFWGTNLDLLLRSNGIKSVWSPAARPKAASSPRRVMRCSPIITSSSPPTRWPAMIPPSMRRRCSSCPGDSTWRLLR